MYLLYCKIGLIVMMLLIHSYIPEQRIHTVLATHYVFSALVHYSLIRLLHFSIRQQGQLHDQFMTCTITCN